MSTYRCAICQEHFESDWSDAEALEELSALFPDVPVEECEVACDDCFNRA